jgi:hypothetical protein
MALSSLRDRTEGVKPGHGSLMRHEATKRTRREDAPRHAAEDPFPYPAVAIGPGHQQVGVLVQGKLDQMIRIRPVAVNNWPRIRGDSVSSQIADDVFGPG